MHFLAVLSSFVSVVLAASRTSPPAGAIVVTKNPSSGQYSTLSAAIASLSTTSTAAQSIFIYPGTYTEQVVIPARSAALTIYGSTSDTTSYKSNSVTVTYNRDATSAGSDDASGEPLSPNQVNMKLKNPGTVRNQAANTKFYNINIANTFGSGSQAIALSAYNSKQGYYGVQLTGYQDTLLAQTGTQLYAKSLITGRTDFIFGQHSPAWFDGVDIRVLGGPGYITASGRTSSTDPNFYVFNKCTIAAQSGQSIAAGAFYLGRPWGDYARVAFQNTDMSNVINAAGWTQWNTGDARTDHVTFEEYGNTGVGASGTRASFSKKMAEPIKIETVLGSDYESWVDGAYL